MHSRTAVRCIAFFLLLAAVIAALSAVFASAYTSSLAVSGEASGSLDYLVIGDSEAITSVSPMQIWMEHGYTGYNCGVPSQRLQDTYYLLEEILKQQSPKVVLLEANSLFTNWNLVGESELIAEKVLGQLVPLFGNHNLWKNALPGTGKSNDALAGFKCIRTVSAYTGGPYMAATDAVKTVSHTQRLWFSNIAELCAQNGITLILYNSPAPKNWTAEKHNGAQQLAESAGIAYIDLNLFTDELGIDWQKDTYDTGDHVNLSGAQKVTAFLGAYLERNTDLADHGANVDFSVWDDRLKRYLAIL